MIKVYTANGQVIYFDREVDAEEMRKATREYLAKLSPKMEDNDDEV